MNDEADKFTEPKRQTLFDRIREGLDIGQDALIKFAEDERQASIFSQRLFGLPIVRIHDGIVITGHVPPQHHGRTQEQALEYVDPLIADHVDENRDTLEAYKIAYIEDPPDDYLAEELAMEAHVITCRECEASLTRSGRLQLCAHCLDLKVCTPIRFAQRLTIIALAFDSVPIYEPIGGTWITLALCRRCSYNATRPRNGSLLLLD